MIHRLLLKTFGSLPRFVRHRIVRLLYPTFTAGVGVCFKDTEGRIALVTHSYSRDWGLPGGLINRGEDARQTASREMLEELGIELAINSPPTVIQTPGRRHFNFLFVADLDDSHAASLSIQSPELTAIEWYSIDQLPVLAEYTDIFLIELGVLPPPNDDLTLRQPGYPQQS